MSKSTPHYRPGETAPESGQYGVRGPRGGDTGREITHIGGDPLPPTPRPGMFYEFVDKTKHKGK